MKDKKYAQLVLGTLIIEDVAAIFMMIVLSTISISKDVSGIELGSELGKMILYLIFWLLLGIYLIPTILKKSDKYLNAEILLIVSLGLCLAMVVIANHMGFSSALGAFLAGSILAGTLRAEQIEELVKPIKDFFGAVFFVSVGMLVNPDLIVKYIVPIIIITLVTIIGQMTFSFIGVLLSGQSLRTAVGAGMSMVQIGEFSFIIASLGTSLGVTSEFLYPIVVSVSVITTFSTPLFIKKIDKAYSILLKILPKQLIKIIKQYTSEKQNENEKDPDWKEFLRKYIQKTAITTVLLFCIYIVGKQVLIPILYNYGIKYSLAKWVSGILTVLLMIPAINLMSYKRNIIYTKLWLKGKNNRLPLLVFKSIKVLITIFFVMLAISIIIDINIFILWVFSFVIVIFSAKSDFMIRNSIKIETRFIANFNERILENNKKKNGINKGHSWLDETLLVEEYQINKILVEDPEKNFYTKYKLGVQIIKIIRDGKHINNPYVESGIKEGDVIVVMGKNHNLDSYEMILEKIAIFSKKTDKTKLKEYIYRQIFTSMDEKNYLFCIAVNIKNPCEFYNKTVQSSKIKEKYQGFVIGIDRGALSIINPNKKTQIEEGDVLWVLGTEKTFDKFLQKNILN